MLRKIGLFFLSLWLLFVLIIIITIKVPVCISDDCQFIGVWALIKMNVIPMMSIFALIVGAVSFWDFRWRVRGTQELSFKIVEIEGIDYEHLTFLTTYIIPLVCFNFTDTRYQIVFWLVLVIIGVIYIRTDLFYANPTLAVLQFRLYKVKGEFRNGEVKQGRILITKDTFQMNDMVKYIKLDERIYYAYKTRQ